MVGSAIALGAGVIQFLGSMASAIADGRIVIDRVTSRKILSALREIYFYDDRTLSLLDRTISGEELNSEDVDRAQEGFRINNERIRKALDDIEAAALDPHPNLTLEAYNNLRGLSKGKDGVRFMIKHFLYYLGTSASSDEERAERIEQAKRIRAQIEEINARITIIDNSLRGLG